MKLTNEDIKLLREQFIHKYSKDKGWNVNNLSSNQMLEIVTQSGYKNPVFLI